MIRALMPVLGIFLLWELSHHRAKKVKKKVFEYTIGGQVVGVAAVRKMGPVMVLASLVVDERVRGVGIGTAMMKKVLQHAKFRKCRWVTLSSGARRVGARRFYRKHGFQHIGWSFFVKKI